MEAVSLNLDHNPVLALRLHGWGALEPFRREDGDVLRWVAHLPTAGPTVVRIHCDEHARSVRVVEPSPVPPADAEWLSARLRWMFRAEEDFGRFWRICEEDPALRPARDLRAGALLRAGSLFEDVVKTMLTVNCTWTNTTRMSTRLCQSFGRPARDGDVERFTFPAAKDLARATDAELRATGLGYRAPWISRFATDAVSGRIDLDRWVTMEDPQALRNEALEVAGVGPYSANHILMTLGHYGMIPPDTEVAADLGLPPGASTKEIEAAASAAYGKWGAYAFLAYRLRGYLERQKLSGI